MTLGIVLGLAGTVALAQGLAFLADDRPTRRGIGVALAPLGVLLVGVGLALALVPGPA